MTITLSGDLSSLAAWYAAIIATLALLVQIVQHIINERVRVKVMYGVNYVLSTNPSQKLVRIDILNIGRRPVTISAVSAFPKERTDKIIVLPESLDPLELLEGKSKSYYFPQEDGLLDKVDCFIVNDMIGKSFKVKYRGDHRDQKVRGMHS
ncbi:MAG TPA: hypothetical protein PKH10_06390 [bacterium]|nr:hypothetical protein [bacterium]